MQFQLAGECASGWRRFIRTFIVPAEFFMIDVDAYDAWHHVDFMDELMVQQLQFLRRDLE